MGNRGQGPYQNQQGNFPAPGNNYPQPGPGGRPMNRGAQVPIGPRGNPVPMGGQGTPPHMQRSPNLQNPNQGQGPRGGFPQPQFQGGQRVCIFGLLVLTYFSKCQYLDKVHHKTQDKLHLEEVSQLLDSGVILFLVGNLQTHFFNIHLLTPIQSHLPKVSPSIFFLWLTKS